jgi:hypothetical protein
MGRIVSATYGDETGRVYVPPPLPPVPALELSGLTPLIERASRAFGRLTINF